MAVFQNAVKSNVAQSATSVTVKPATVGVGGFVIYNDSAADLYLAAGSDAASLTNYTWKVPSNGYLQEPGGNFLYIGPITGIWSAGGAGAARVTTFSV